MSGDYSRVRFDHRIDLSGVQMQQGRVQLDSDWNEWVAVLDRRLRAESVDTLGVHVAPGVTGVAVVSPQTPDAFKILASGGSISIGRGRMYVDGLLVENHGGGAQEFDPVLAELRGLSALTYNQQPYFIAPPVLPGGGPHLAYLEVWQREITYLQQPSLVDSALGVDTTTRLQNVWQVRMLANFSGASCTSPDATVAAWQTLIRPSGGRMSIKAEGVPPDLDPCELPPGGGYRGLENQLYRIEIHDGGAAGVATFKWSRDNASVASNVTEIVSNTATATELKLASLGRDAVLRFNTGDWVEILDDRRELNGENGDPALRRGVMRKITVDDAKQAISFSPALPANLIPTGGLDTLAARHTRVRRWDQKGTVRDANNNVIGNIDADGGLIKVPTGVNVWVVLENGIQIQLKLDPVGGSFHSGDYWVSAARTADTSVETYTLAPPRGIHRHYARLAIVTFPDAETDCRVKWPPECGGCCTINVAPGENIQTAIDLLPDEGGCVCLKTGVHNISSTIQLLSSRIILRGEGPGAIVRSAGLATSLQIGGVNAPVTDIIVEGLRFEVSAAMSNTGSSGTLIFMESCTRVRVEHCAFAVVVPSTQATPTYIGISLNHVTDVDVISNRLDNLLIGIMSQDYLGGLNITGNAISGVTGTFLGQGNSAMGQYGIRIDTEHTQACRIENNRIRDFWVGVLLRHQAAGSLVAGNRISRSAGITQDKFPADAAQQRNYLDTRLYAIEIEAAYCDVRGNHIDLHSAAWGGIRVSGAHVTIDGNVLGAVAQADQVTVPASIYCQADAKMGLSADHVVVRGNSLLGPQFGIVVSRIAGPAVSGNHLDGGGAGWYGVRVDDCTDSRIEHNDLREMFFAVHLTEGARNSVADNRIDLAATGITATQEADIQISGNTLQSCVVLGMALFVRGSVTLIDNRVLSCGQFSLFSAGIAVFAEEVWTPSGAHLRIENCEVLDTGISADGKQVTTLNTMGIGGWIPSCQINGNRVAYTQPAKLDPLKEHRALLLIGPLALQYTTGPGELAYRFGSAQVVGNQFSGPGRTCLVEFMRIELTDNIALRFEKLTFSNNISDHFSAEANAKGATVSLFGGHVVSMGNHVKAAAKVNSMSLGSGNKTALMGNITTGDYINIGSVTPLPINNFNVKI